MSRGCPLTRHPRGPGRPTMTRKETNSAEDSVLLSLHRARDSLAGPRERPVVALLFLAEDDVALSGAASKPSANLPLPTSDARSCRYHRDPRGHPPVSDLIGSQGSRGGHPLMRPSDGPLATAGAGLATHIRVDESIRPMRTCLLPA